MKKLIAFDLDGVLINSIKNMEMSWDIVRLHHKIEVPFEEYKKQIGKPFFDILNELGITIINSISENQQNRNEFLFHYSMHEYSSV